MRIYNSLTGKKEELTKPHKGPLKLFVCGPTVYDVSHIGHARTYIVFDNIVKYLRGRGYKVKYVQNITNIDDKIIVRAQERNVEPLKLADEMTKSYLADMKALGVTAVDKYAPATKFIEPIVRQVKDLIKKGFAYKLEGDGYYYDISKFKDYGKLSGRTAAQSEDAVSRIDESVRKRNRGDFALWKFAKPAEPFWKTSLGDGRPGWHIEDTAISEKYFGPQYDLHGGGLDLKFPHHEAEIAQQEAASGKKPFVKFWMHSGMLTVNGEKMAKSLNNFMTVKQFLIEHPVNVLRLIVAQHNYRSPIDYCKDLVSAARSALDSLGHALAKLNMSAGKQSLDEELESAEAQFHKAMEDDFNTPAAMAVIFNLVNSLNPKVWSISRRSARQAEKWLTEKLKIFGISLKSPKIPFKIRALAKKRELYRGSKQFTQSDALRKDIEALGYTIEDTPKGPFLWPKNLS